jgi:hypothetical protein
MSDDYNHPPRTQITHCQLLSAIEVRDCQAIPSDDVIIRFPVPDWATATNSPKSSE